MRWRFPLWSLAPLIDSRQALLEHNAKVYLAARSPARAQTAIDQLKQETGKEAIFLKLDLSDLKQVRQAASDFLS